MTTLASIRCVFLIGLCIFAAIAKAQAQREEKVLIGSQLSSGFDMGVNSSSGRTDWLKKEQGDMKISYPSGQSWGAVFITVGRPKQPPRPFRDFSAFDTISVEMKGGAGGEDLEIGIKTNKQLDDGSETKIPVKMTPEWLTYELPLDKFSGVDLKRLYVVIEFVFSDKYARTVYFRNVTFLKRGASKEDGFTKNVDTLPSSLQNPNSIAPKVTITYPPDQREISSWSGNRPSILVQGTANSIPQGDKLFLVLHPVSNDYVWATEINLSGQDWISQAYIGGPGGLPSNEDTFEIFTTIRDPEHSLPLSFIIKDEPLFYPSNIVTVKVKVVSWLDKAVAFGKDLQISLPVGAFFTACGLVVGGIIGKKAQKNGGAEGSKERDVEQSQTGS